MSKDFGANGLRVGALIVQSNQTFHQVLKAVGLYSSTSSVSDHIAATILFDDTWTDSYIERTQQRLSESYDFVTEFLRKHGISYATGANAAFFIWADFGKTYSRNCDSSPPSETNPGSGHKDTLTNEINQALMQEKVFLGSGVAFGAETPGLFRVVFAHPKA